MTISEDGLFNFSLEERSVIKLTGVERKGKSKLTARIETQSKHLAIFELHVLESCLVDSGQTKIAFVQRAACKLVVRKILVRKVAVVKRTILVLTLFQSVNSIKSFVGGVFCRHDGFVLTVASKEREGDNGTSF